MSKEKFLKYGIPVFPDIPFKFLFFHSVSALLHLPSLALLESNVNSSKMMLQVRAVMVENIDKVLDRGDRIELLVDKTSTIQDNAFHFKKQSRRLRQAMWMENAKLL